MKKGMKRIISTAIATTMIALPASSLAANIYVGNVGFDLDRVSNESVYRGAFQDYVQANFSEKQIVDSGFGDIYELNDKSNNIDTPVNQLPQKQIPAGAKIWDGTGTPGDSVVTELKVESVSAINGTGDRVSLEGATVSRNTTYEVKFNGMLDKETVSNSTFKVLKDGVQVAISSPILNLDTVTFSTLAALDANVDYTLVVEGVKSEEGSEVAKKVIDFKTAAETVVRNVTVSGVSVTNSTLYNPNLTTAVADIQGTWDNTSDKFTVEFDEAIDSSTLNSSSVKLIDVKTGKTLAVEASLQAQRQKMDIEIVGTTDFLMPKEQYKLVLDGVKAANGNEVEPFELEFSYQQPAPTVQNAGVYLGASNTVAGTGSTTKVNPSTSSTLLGDKSTYKEGAKLSVDFGADKARLDESTITTDYFKLINTKTDEEVAVTLNYVKDTNRVELTPVSDLEDNAEYRVTVSQHVKNVNGLPMGKKDSDAFKSTIFETYDVTAPEVKDINVIGGDINDLKVGETVTVEIEFSEKVATPSINSNGYTNFASGNGNGSIGIFRADNNGTTTDLTIGSPSLSTDGKTVKFSVTVDNDNVAGYAYKVILAGYNPVRGNSATKVIVDNTTNTSYRNALASDYMFNFTVEGEDTVAPKILGAKAQQGSASYVELDGATNVKGNIQFNLDDKVANIHGTNKGKVEFYQNGSVIGTTTLSASEYSEIGNKAVITVAAPNVTGTVEARVSEIQDKNGNESSTYRANFVAGKGESVKTAKFITLDAGATLTADNASIEIEFDGAMDRATITESNIKVYDGETEITGALDLKDFTSNKVYFKPTTKFTAGKAYKLVVSEDVKDAKGNHLQPVATQAPKDYDLTISAPTTGDIEVAENGVYDEEARTVTFNFTQDVDTTGLVIKNKATGVTVSSTSTATIDSNDAKKVVVTLNDAFAKNTEYEVGLTANATGSNTVATSTFVPTKNLKVDSVVGAPEVSVGAVNTATGATILTFTEPVKVSDVKAAVKVYDATNTADVKLFDSSFAYTETSAGYASSVTVTIPGYASANDYYLTIAEGSIADEAGFKNEDAVEVTLSAGGGADLTAPTVTIGALSTDNASTTHAKSGDKVELAFTTDEAIDIANSTVTILGKTATVVSTGANAYKATITLDGTEAEAAVSTYAIDVVDAAGNATATVNTGATGSVTVDFTAISGSTVTGTYKDDDATKIEAGETLIFTFDEEIATSDIAALKAEFETVFTPETSGSAADGFTVATSTVANKTVVTVTADASLTATAIATFNTDGTITLTAANLTDLAGNTPATNLVVDFK